MPPSELPADVPKTDRELLLQLNQKIDYILDRLDGESGLCSTVRMQDERIKKLERDRWYLAGALGLLILLVGSGRLIELLYVVPR
jgi:hypothetical protein